MVRERAAVGLGKDDSFLEDHVKYAPATGDEIAIGLWKGFFQRCSQTDRFRTIVSLSAISDSESHRVPSRCEPVWSKLRFCIVDVNWQRGEGAFVTPALRYSWGPPREE